MRKFVQHIRRRTTQENASSVPKWFFHRLLTRTANGLFLVVWKFFFSWVPLIWGRWWRRLCLRFVFRECGRQLNVSTGVHIEYPWRISVGGNVWIGRECNLEGMGGIVIGDDVMLAFQTVLQSAGHEFKLALPVRLQTIVRKPIVIGNDVWLGARTMVRYGVKIGDKAVSGMGAVIVKDVQPGMIVGGVPAKVIGSRFNPERSNREELRD